MVLEIEGSSPSIHPQGVRIQVYSAVPVYIGLSPRGKAQDFDSCIRWFKSSQPSFGALAQVVEHLTFNQVVAGSSPAWLM